MDDANLFDGSFINELSIITFPTGIKIIGNIRCTLLDTYCPKCKGRMEKREHLKIVGKLRRQPFYYTEWERCTRCDYQYLNPKHRRENKCKLCPTCGQLWLF